MKIDGNVGEADTALSEGDRITVSISHQIRIAGEESWVKMEYNSAVRPGENAEQAADRVAEFVNRRAMQTVHEVVTKVREAVS